MLEAVIIVLAMCLVSFYTTIGMIRYNTKLKKDEGFNTKRTPIINQEKYNLKGNTEVSKNETSCECKSYSSKKKTI